LATLEKAATSTFSLQSLARTALLCLHHENLEVRDPDGVNIAPKYSSNPPEGISSIRRNYGDDARSEVITDDRDNIYLASCTQSSDFPLTPNAFRNSLGGGQDGVFIKANPDLTNIFNCTYLGGGGDDAAFVLAISRTTGNIYVGGGTTSNDLAFNATDAPQGILHKNFQGGACDGFISEISADCEHAFEDSICGYGGK
jgi:hypothetical protein